MKLSEKTGISELLKLKSDWKRLSGDSKYSYNPFIEFERIIASIEYQNENNLITYIAYNKIAYLAGAEFADYNDLLIMDSYEEIISLIFEKILHRCNLVYIKNIAAIGCLYNNIERIDTNNVYFKIYKKNISPIIILSTKWVNFPENLKKSLKYDIKYNLRRLKSIGDLDFTVLKNYDSQYELLNVLFDLHKKEWHLKGQESIFDKTDVCEYYRKIIKDMQYSNASIVFMKLELNHNVIALVFGFQKNDRYFYYKPVYNPEYKKYSPGKIMLSYVIEYCLSNNIEIVDMLRGMEEYKSLWANDHIELYDLLSGRRSIMILPVIKYLQKRYMRPR